MEPHKKPFDLEDRFVRFAGEMVRFTRSLSKFEEGLYLRDQLMRSASAAALNFGETQGAESSKDAVHKLGLVLKELKESRVGLKITDYLVLGNSIKRTDLLGEVEQLIAIIATIRKNKTG